MKIEEILFLGRQNKGSRKNVRGNKYDVVVSRYKSKNGDKKVSARIYHAPRGNDINDYEWITYQYMDGANRLYLVPDGPKFGYKSEKYDIGGVGIKFTDAKLWDRINDVLMTKSVKLFWKHDDDNTPYLDLSIRTKEGGLR